MKFNKLNRIDMAKAIIYVPWMLVDAFKLDAEEHELEMKFLQNDLAGNAVFEAEGGELENPEWMKELEEVDIEVSVYSEILEEV